MWKVGAPERLSGEIHLAQGSFTPQIKSKHFNFGVKNGASVVFGNDKHEELAETNEDYEPT